MRVSRFHIILWTVISVILAGCSGPIEPDNLEPVLEMLPAQDITRTEAVVSARIHKRGTGQPTYAVFRYGATDGPELEAVPEDPTADMATARLSNLRPGTTYFCRLDAGTSTAALHSATITFTTQPNEAPTVSAPAALSTGPLGIIVEFEIVSDGGEAVSQAGCEVTQVNTGVTSRLYLPSEELATGPHRLNIGGLELMSTYSITPFASNPIGETRGLPLEYTTSNSIVLKEAGTLAAVFEGTSRVELPLLTVSGPMNGDDFRFLRHLLGAPSYEPAIESAVSELNLTDAHIVEGGGSYNGSRFTETDMVSTDLFADCAALRGIILPATATVLARNAFARCRALESLTVSAAIASVLPSEECTSLINIMVSAANTGFTAVDGVLFNREVSEILWFPLGKDGEYTLPPTVTSIGENAFYGTSITSLGIPPSVTAIGRGAFAGSSLTEISLPDNITNVSEGMFQNCSTLTTVRLGTGTRYIGNYAFDGTALTDIYAGATTPPFAADEAFVNGNSTICGGCTLHVPAGCRQVYRLHRKWGLFGSIIEY